ncbi:hypothetical protein FRB91_011543 [Serendipita sp. 411]|nr:hypothetical protein FRB91_011543 [Serendipita sp. 411]
MSSGSSGGAETHGSTSGSDILSCSETSTEIETPPETPAREVDPTSILPPGSPGSPTESTPRIPYESEQRRPSMTRPRAYYATYLPNEAIGYDFGEVVPKMFKLGSGDLDTSYEEDSYGGDLNLLPFKVSERPRRGRSMLRTTPRKRYRTKESQKHSSEDTCVIYEADSSEPGDSLPVVSFLKRSRRLPPLDLSTILSRPAPSLPTDQSPMPHVRYEEATPNAEYMRPFTAPLPAVAPLEAELLPPLPATAPIFILPKAPRIRPTVISEPRSPSPLTLPSPKVPWDGVRGDMRPETPPPVESTLPPVSRILQKRGAPRLPSGQRRKVSLSKQMAELQSSFTTSPIPPSLFKSPLLTHPGSPFITSSPKLANAPTTPPTHSLLTSPGQPPNATPLRLHMNPYFSEVVLSNVGTRRVSTSWPVQADSLLEHNNNFHNTHPDSHNLLDHYFTTDVVDTGIY